MLSSITIPDSVTSIGEHAFLLLVESETATATFAPIIIYTRWVTWMETARLYIEQYIVVMRDTLGKRVEVVFVTEMEETTYTVETGEVLATWPDAPEGFLWSAEAETYVPPVFTTS